MPDYNDLVHGVADHIEHALTAYDRHLRGCHDDNLTVALVKDALEEVSLRCDDLIEGDEAAIRAEWEGVE